MRCVEQIASSGGARVFSAIDRGLVLEEVSAWASALPRAWPQVVRIGLFGSYARGDYAPGSDLDILVLVSTSPEPTWFMRSAAADASALSVGADVFVFTEAESVRMEASSAWFRRILAEMVWVWPAGLGGPPSPCQPAPRK